jgi:hypothetical protein
VEARVAAVAREEEKVVILTSRVQPVTHRAGIEETAHHRRNKKENFNAVIIFVFLLSGSLLGLTNLPVGQPIFELRNRLLFLFDVNL